MARILINNGTIVSATGASAADVLVDGETIAALLEPGQAAALGINADDAQWLSAAIRDGLSNANAET